MKPDDLTDKMVRSIGREYLQQYPTATFFHENQAAANLLANFDENCSIITRWNILLCAYSQLTHTSGIIARRIEDLFRKVCGELPSKSYEARSLLDTTTMQYTVQQYAEQLAAKIREKISSLSPAERHFLVIGPGRSLDGHIV